MSASHITYDKYLDAKGLNCPLPILKAKVALNKMQPGQVLFVEATDPHSIIDFEAYCARSGHEILHINEDNGIVRLKISRAQEPVNI